MKSVLISIRPKWCELIASGKKTIEVRKTKPKIKTPFKCYIYECNWKENTKWSFEHQERLGKVIGEFVCDEILVFAGHKFYDDVGGFIHDRIQDTCLTEKEIGDYLDGKYGYGWHISNLVIYDKSRELSEFKKIHRNCWYADLGLAKRDCEECKNKECFITRPPRSWCYVEGGK